jgi:hypothetical protein
LTTVLTGGKFTPDGNITLTRIQVQLQTGPASCKTNAVIQVTNGTSTDTVALLGASSDSGPLSINLNSGVPISVGVSVAAAGCKTNPQNANVLVQYKGR